MTTTAAVEALLDGIRRSGVAPVSVEDYLCARRLLQELPSLDRITNARALRAAIASIVATSHDQWMQVWHLSAALDPTAPESLKGSFQDHSAISNPTRRTRRLPDRIADLPRGMLVGVCAAAFVALVSIVCFALVRPAGPTPAPPAPAAPLASSHSNGNFWRLDQTKAPFSWSIKTPEVSVRDVDWNDGFALALGALLVALGAAWVHVPYRVRASRRAEAHSLSARGHEQRRELSRAAEQNNVSRRLTYAVPETPPMSDDAVADSATLLARIFGRIDTETLDTDATVRATVAEGGRFVAVKAQRAVSRHLNILVDLEKGDHPWAADVDWLLRRWASLGVKFDCYDFQFDPSALTSRKTGISTTIEALARRSEGEPLLIVSRKLSTRDMDGEASWLSQIAAWPTRAWLDPAPITRGEIPRLYRFEIDKLAKRGFFRFPMTDLGVGALAAMLTGGSPTIPSEPDPLPPLSNKEMMAAIKRWALFASLVPDATWRQLQYVRKTLPDLNSTLPTNRHLQRLLDWASTVNLSGSGESGDGSALALDKDQIEQLILENRKREAGLPREKSLEALCRKMLLEQLAADRPTDALMYQFWQFKHAQHRLFLEPHAALEDFSNLLGGAWHTETQTAIETALERDRILPQLPSSIRDGLQITIAAGSDFVRWTDLGRLFSPRTAAMATIAMLTVLEVWLFSMTIPQLLHKSATVNVTLPADYRFTTFSVDLRPSANFDEDEEAAEALIPELPKPKPIVVAPYKPTKPQDPSVDIGDGDIGSATRSLSKSWMIQIGAYDSAAAARTQLAKYADRSIDLLGQARRTVVPFQDFGGQKKFRARFGPFTENDARSICTTLTVRNLTCFAAPTN